LRIIKGTRSDRHQGGRRSGGSRQIIRENFYRNAINIGLPIFESVEASKGISEGDEIEIDADNGVIKDITTGKTFKSQAHPEFMQKLIAAGGLMKHIQGKIKK